MAIYEKRTYDIIVGEMPKAIKAYQEIGWPAIEAGGFDKWCVGYFTSDTGALHQLIHIWRFEDDADRRSFWKRLFADEAFQKFIPEIRSVIAAQEVQLLNGAPWGPTAT